MSFMNHSWSAMLLLLLLLLICCVYLTVQMHIQACIPLYRVMLDSEQLSSVYKDWKTVCTKVGSQTSSYWSPTILHHSPVNQRLTD